MDLRAEDPNGKYGHPTLRLVAGRFPDRPRRHRDDRRRRGDVRRAHRRSVRRERRDPPRRRTRREPVGPERRVRARRAGPGQPAGSGDDPVRRFRHDKSTRSARRASTVGIGTRSTANKTAAAVVVLALETIGLLFVGLVAAAGFAVMAQRRLRALGMLGALGATDRQVRLAMVANGTVVGVVGAVTGAVLGLADVGCARAPLREPRQSPRRPIPPAVVGDRGRDGPRGRDRRDRRVVAGAVGGPVIDRRGVVGAAVATQTRAPVCRRRRRPAGGRVRLPRVRASQLTNGRTRSSSSPGRSRPPSGCCSSGRC